MPRRVTLALVALGGLIACGGEDGPRVDLSTPPERPGVAPLPEVARAQERAERAAQRAAAARPTPADARRVTPVLRAWGEAVRRNQSARASELFAVPVIIAQGGAVRLNTAAQVRRFNLSLPCGARLLRVDVDGRYVVGTFRLTPRPRHTCSDTGAVVRVAFVVRDRKIAEWRQVPPGADPDPEPPPAATPAPPEQVS